jgi:hypothetical protein
VLDIISISCYPYGVGRRGSVLLPLGGDNPIRHSEIRAVPGLEEYLDQLDDDLQYALDHMDCGCPIVISRCAFCDSRHHSVRACTVLYPSEHSK